MDIDASKLPNLDEWQTSNKYFRDGLDITTAKFLEVSDVLLENPNLNSSHLFRADILLDSAGTLKTIAEKEKLCYGSKPQTASLTCAHDHVNDHSTDQLTLDGNAPSRVVVRRLIPRNSTLDRALDQTCSQYQCHHQDSTTTYIVIYLPHVKNEAEIPWYHPPVKALAYVYEALPECSQVHNKSAKLSLRFLPFSKTLGPIPDRLHRTFVSLLDTLIRLSKHNTHPASNLCISERTASGSTAPSAIKDTIIAQHLVQNTYSRLKQTYASDLIARWVESTEPSKHVFEDLSIAAFLIELWKLMYHDRPFPGFVDIACGNGVLVYFLLKEGYHGWGFDARRRKTWAILGIDEHLEERICIPQPFLTALELTVDDALPGVRVHNGIFRAETFIISNHADELTPWTPLLAALSCPESPLPFLAVPCCSHALSGAKHRYTPKDLQPPSSPNTSKSTPSQTNNAESSVNDTECQPSTGDLRSLRTQKAKAANHTDDKSMYACLTKKVIALAEEVGFEVEMTLMRIPSTRNIGVVGGRKRVQAFNEKAAGSKLESRCGEIEKMRKMSLEADANGHGERESVLDEMQMILQRECARSEGLQASARTWIDKARKLQTGKGRGKVNLGHKPDAQNGKHAQ